MSKSDTLPALWCRCGVAITLELSRASSLLSVADGRPLVPLGKFWVVDSDFDEWNGPTPGDYLLNRESLVGCKEIGLRQGCCGPDGMDGPNLACSNGHDIGTEIADCWTPDFVWLLNGKFLASKRRWQ